MYSVNLNLMVLILVLINVAFVTLMERKILGLSQYRKGPNKVSAGGILQPISDAVKLFLKELVVPLKSNTWLFAISPLMSLLLSLLLWNLIPFSSLNAGYWVSSILFLVILGFGTYPLLLMGWSSNSKYSMVGALRGVAQTISYEISLALLVFNFTILSGSLKLLTISMENEKMSMLSVIPVISILWLLSCVAETNRTPFDFAEGESELVSGFNIEYGSSGFTLIFMSEYSMILLFSMLSGLLLMFSSMSVLYMAIFMMGLSFFWVWLRATLPRYRYDKLMNLAWKSFLPVGLVVIFWSLALVS